MASSSSWQPPPPLWHPSEVEVVPPKGSAEAKRADLVKRASLAGLRSDQPSDVLTQELAALEEAAGPFKLLPDPPQDVLDLLGLNIFGLIALSKTCKHLRVACGMVLAWVPDNEEVRKLLYAFARATKSCTAKQLRDSLRPDLSVLHLTREGLVAHHEAVWQGDNPSEPGHVHIYNEDDPLDFGEYSYQWSMVNEAKETTTGCLVKGERERRRSATQDAPNPCCFGAAPLPVDKPTRWVVRGIHGVPAICTFHGMRKDRGGFQGVGIVGINGSRTLSVMWENNGRMIIGRRCKPWCSSFTGFRPGAVLPARVRPFEEMVEDEDGEWDYPVEEEVEEDGDEGEEWDSDLENELIETHHLAEKNAFRNREALPEQWVAGECVGLEYDPLGGSLTMVHPRLGKSYRVQSNLLVAADQVAAAAATSSSPSTTPAGWRWHVSVETFRGGGCSVDRLLA